ncbi:MAG TPA: spirocyclase AveC family protein [Nevskiaceae bacterium]|nr:spirocyclase AveC family protein [Nevskiaceae bacterium]
MSTVSPLASGRPVRVDTSASVLPVACWAALGAIVALFSLSVFGQWILSPAEFAAVPIREADAMAGNGVLLIRGLEVVSTSVALWAFWNYLVRPWMKNGEAPILGLLLIAALITYVFDTMVNYGGYWMAFNKHSIDWGTWAAFFPGHTGPTRYAEALFWGPPMYLYFGIALAEIQLRIWNRLEARRVAPSVMVAVVFAAAFLFDLVAESAIIQGTEAYAWPTTVGALTIWKGEQFQFPLYESFLVGCYATLYMFLMRSARNHPRSFIERGVDRVPAGLRLPVRLLAATGFAAVCTLVYFGGFVIISQWADNTVAIPSYLMFDGR